MQLQARMRNPVTVIPEALNAVYALGKAARTGGVPESVSELVHLRISQINGCSVCIAFGIHNARKSGMPDDQLFAVAAWRESPHFNDAERAALALAEAATRLADRPDAVSDEVWEEAARHYDERGLASLVLVIASTNLFNRINATTRQIPGQEW